jgi:hypothetical protein
MCAKKRTIANTPHAEALNELRAAVPADTRLPTAPTPEVVIYTTPGALIAAALRRCSGD